MNNLTELKKSILARSAIDESAVRQLQEVLPDNGGMNKEKANMLFELKDAFLNRNNHPEWKAFFTDAITSFLLEDDETPGEIDNSEAQWLRAKIQYDGKLGKIDKMLLANLKKKSINFPEILHFKSKSVLFFEAILYGTRFITFLAVVGSLLASITLFITSTLQVVKGIHLFIDMGESVNMEHLIVIFVSTVDGYLFATVLMIFSMGVYELFIHKIDVVRKQKDARPSWLIINSIDDLKSSLGKVILMILIVSFFEHSLKIRYESVSDLLFLGIGILLIAVALFLTHVHGKHHEK
ncbi:MAG: YqhA family protein, partial [Bacteroidales bacterium]|nr:YqhA family protein [Bacteroidales bacterium]